MNRNDSIEPPQAWQVICLCAQWCGVCREWRDLFDQVAAAHDAVQAGVLGKVLIDLP